MGASLKLNAHIVDVLGNVIGRDQPILRMERAIDMCSFLDDILNDEIVLFDPFCKAGELLLSCAYLACRKKQEQGSLVDVDLIYNEIFKSNKYYALAPDERHHRLSLRTFLGNSHSHDPEYNQVIRNGNYLSEVDGTLNKDKYTKELVNMIEFIKEKSGNKKNCCCWQSTVPRIRWWFW
jgi:hypothetical protein